VIPDHRHRGLGKVAAVRAKQKLGKQKAENTRTTLEVEISGRKPKSEKA
jgi:hypothetical protein